MADREKELACQPSIDSLVFDLNKRISRSPISIAFDAASSRQLSTDLEYGNDGTFAQHANTEKSDHVPTAQNSCDPILARDSNFIDPSLVGWNGEKDPENPLYWPPRRKVWMSIMVSFMTFGVSLASSIFSEDIHVTAEEFRASEELMVLGVSLYVLGFACGM